MDLPPSDHHHQIRGVNNEPLIFRGYLRCNMAILVVITHKKQLFDIRVLRINFGVRNKKKSILFVTHMWFHPQYMSSVFYCSEDVALFLIFSLALGIDTRKPHVKLSVLAFAIIAMHFHRN